MEESKLTRGAKVIAYIDEVCPHLNKYQIPLAEAQANTLCDLFGYDNVMNYVTRLGNFQKGKSRYIGVFLTLHNWMGEDLRKGTLALQPCTAGEANSGLDELRRRFIIEYPPGSDFFINGRKLSVASDGNFIITLLGYVPIREFLKKNIIDITKLLEN